MNPTTTPPVTNLLATYELYILNHMFRLTIGLVCGSVEYLWCNTYHQTRTMHSIPVVFSESEFYCILVSPVIICRSKVQ